jgi:hypothetical protein
MNDVLMVLLGFALATAVVFYVELRVVPRVQRRLRREAEAAQRVQEEASERRTRELHDELLAHSERVAREARIGQGLFGLRDSLLSLSLELGKLQLDLVTPGNLLAGFVTAKPSANASKALLMFSMHCQAWATSAHAQVQTTAAECVEGVQAVIMEVFGGRTTLEQARDRIDPNLDRALKLIQLACIGWLFPEEADEVERLKQAELAGVPVSG